MTEDSFQKETGWFTLPLGTITTDFDQCYTDQLPNIFFRYVGVRITLKGRKLFCEQL